MRLLKSRGESSKETLHLLGSVNQVTSELRVNVCPLLKWVMDECSSIKGSCIKPAQLVRKSCDAV